MILLDAYEHDTDTLYVMTADAKGQTVFDSDGTQRFDPEDLNNIGYWLNNDFLKNGSNGKILPDEIKKYIDNDREWFTEGGFSSGNCPKDYTVKCGVTLLSQLEWQKYDEVFGVLDDIPPYGWWLRTGRGIGGGTNMVLVGKTGDGRIGETFGDDAKNTVRNFVRPAFYLKPEFFTTVKLDVIGANVGKKLANHFSYEDFQGEGTLGYSDTMLRNAGFDVPFEVRDGDDAINENMAVLRTSAEYEDLYNTWLAHDKGVDYQKILKYVLYAGSVCFIFLAAYLIVSYRAKQKLAELVEIRTAELYETNQKLERRTAQVEAENRLRYSIIEASPAGMVLVDEHMHIEYMNSRALQIAGIQTFRSGEVLGRLRIFREILRDAGGKIFAEDWDYKAGSFEFYNDKGHRNRENYRYSIHKMTLSEGEQGALITLENVTAEENEREAAFEKEKNETLNSLIAGIAHEIKNPLTAISASAAMIQEKGDNEKFRQAFSAFIPQEIDRVTRLINSLIDYARPSGSKIELVNLNEIILSVAELARVTAKKIDITVELDTADQLQFIGDRDKMKQSLLNLVINSAEAIRQKQDDIQSRHRIVISAGRMDERLIIKVEDDGIGMSASQLSRCMNPFYTTKAAGTGIGLALTKQYVEEVGGTITVSSERNAFTAVEIQLPAAGGKEGEK